MFLLGLFLRILQTNVAKPPFKASKLPSKPLKALRRRTKVAWKASKGRKALKPSKLRLKGLR